jgi:hypothetical protein
MKTRVVVPLVALLLGASAPSGASDHVDGLKTAADYAADITDLYTFTSPENPERLVLIMNVHPLAHAHARFSDAIDYTFRIRPIDDRTTMVPSADPRREQSVVCTFSKALPIINDGQRATCKFNFGASSESLTFDTRPRAGGRGEKPGLRVFAGVRSDTWFLDLAKTVAFNKGHLVGPELGVNGLWGQNILSIVVEVDKSRLAGPLLAVTAQTVRK